MVYRVLSNCIWHISNQSIRKDTDSAEIYQNSSDSDPNISETISHSMINNYHFLKMCNKTFQMHRCKMVQQT